MISLFRFIDVFLQKISLIRTSDIAQKLMPYLYRQTLCSWTNAKVYIYLCVHIHRHYAQLIYWQYHSYAQHTFDLYLQENLICKRKTCLINCSYKNKKTVRRRSQESYGVTAYAGAINVNYLQSHSFKENGLPSRSLGVGWLGRKDSNLRMPGPKPGALPLGHAPLKFHLM